MCRELSVNTKKYFTFILKLLLILSAGILVSCTGTIEDSSLETTRFGEQKPNTFNYQGLIAARPVAHDKFEIDLVPYQNNFNLYTYELYVNESEVPITVDPNNLIQKTGGVYTYTVSNLLPNSFYSFKLKAKNLLAGTESTKENVLSGPEYKTFDNYVASFRGVGDVELVPGKTSSAVKVSWTPAVMEGQFVLSPNDPAYYEIVLVSEEVGIENINNSNFSGSGRIVQRVPDTVSLDPNSSSTPASPFNNPGSYVIEGLDASTKYYAQVRAVHKLYYDAIRNNVSPIPYDQDSNTILKSVITTGADSPTDIQRDSIILSNGDGADTYSKVTVSWLGAEGSYTGYRVYFRTYDPAVETDTLRPEEDIHNELQDTCEINVTNEIQCVAVASDDTNKIISSLASYTTYQFKVAVCRSLDCPVLPSEPLAAVFSDPAHIRTDARLSDFSGINFINHPDDPANTDQITADFDPVVLGAGFADSLELLCVDPEDSDNYIAFPGDGTAITGSSIANCDGISVTTSLGQNLEDVSDANIESVDQFIIKDVRNINNDTFENATYCFSLNPAIRLKAEEVENPNPTAIVRCISPEIAVPSQEEFEGLNNSCSVNIKDVTVDWDLPSKGVYNKFKVFWKEKDENAFSFEDAIAAGAGYTASDLIDGALEEYTFEGVPGKTYEIAALAVAENDSGDLYSEFNIGITTCSVPYPIATFQEWTRVVAVGPKVDGRVPFDDDSENFSTDRPDEAYIFEAIGADGLILETNPSESSEYELAPGNYSTEPTDYNSKFDGRGNSDGLAASNTGMISIAWKSVTLSALQDEFETGQDLGTRADRVFGYRVYRSHNNRVSWVDVTDQSGLLHHGDYEYFLASSGNANKIETEKMIFFTDYSVSFAQSDDYVDRARIYWYKIVPVFDGAEIQYSEGGFFPKNEIKVVLPPPNVALVHRKMANRQGCLSLGKSIDKDDYYSCDYNGIGSVAKSLPWSRGDTKLDQGGDMFIDRNELGCQYTRGSRSPNPTGTSSYFKDLTKSDADWDSTATSQSVFQGLSNGGTKFKGCSLQNLDLDTNTILLLTSFNQNFADAANATFEHNLFGDCIGSLSQSSEVVRKKPSDFSGTRRTLNLPAADFDISNPSSGAGGSRDVLFSHPDDADFVNTGLFDFDWRQNLMVVSEPYSVFYNDVQSGFVFSPSGPQVADPSTHFSVLTNIEEDTSQNTSNNCYVNLAAIGTDGNWRSRWFPSNHLDQIREDENTDAHISIYDKTIDEVTQIPSLYSDDAASEFKPIDNTQLNDERLNSSTQIARIFSSNHSKLPPLTGHTNDQLNKICSTFSIQVGIGNEDGSFVALSAPKKKRLPRRKDFITASEWSEFPDFYDPNDSRALEKVERDTVSGGGGCNGTNNNSDATLKTPESEIRSDDLKSIYRTGSSRFDGSNQSEYCISKYGVQDLIGNLAETESQKLYCDFSLDHLYLGRFAGSIGYIDESIRIPNSYRKYYMRDLRVLDQDGNDIDPGRDWRPYEVVDEQSGYCSIVDNDASLVESISNFRDLDIFRKVLNPDGTHNSNVVRVPSATDQEAANSLRNGDGSFMNFGLATMFPQFKTGRESSLTNTTEMKGQYFSPIVGLPMSCKGTADYDPCGLEGTGDGDDNTIAATQTMIDKFFPGQEDDFIVWDVRGSRISDTFGTEKVTGGPLPTDEINVDVNGVGDTDPESFGQDGIQVVTEIQLNIDVSGDNTGDGEPIAGPADYTETVVNVSELTPNNYKLLEVRWNSDRGEPVRMKSGGDFDSDNNGRYSVDFHQDEWTNKKTGRCTVIINTDEL